MSPGQSISDVLDFADLQVLLSHAVDAARALAPDSVSKRQDALVGIYITQIVSAVIGKRAY